jgi:lysophospholipase L1-like esterase
MLRRYKARRLAVLGSLVLSAALLGPVGASAVSTPAISSLPVPSQSVVRQLVALGDSVPAGAVCGCVPFPQRTSTLLRNRLGHTVVTHNDSVSGLTTAGLLRQLRTNPTVRAHVVAADVVLVTIGANDVQNNGSCRATYACYLPALRASSPLLEASIQMIFRLKSGHPVAIVLTGYWNVWRDGAVARTLGPAYVATSRALTRAENWVISSATRRHALIYVDLVVPFRGVNDSDDTALLARDGDHPNVYGHARIAAVVDSALHSRLPN